MFAKVLVIIALLVAALAMAEAHGGKIHSLFSVISNYMFLFVYLGHGGGYGGGFGRGYGGFGYGGFGYGGFGYGGYGYGLGYGL